MTKPANHRVPLEVSLQEGAMAVQRAWPAPDGALVIEGADTLGRCRAGIIDAAGVATVSAHRHDARLPGLSTARGDVLVHRLGKRAVLRDTTTGEYVKVTRPGKAARIHRATLPLASELATAGFAVAENSLGPGDDRITAATVPGTLITRLRPEAWSLALAAFERSWASFANPEKRSGRESAAHAALPTHSGADEAAVLAAWLDKVQALDPLLLSASTAERFVEQVLHSCRELSLGAGEATAIAHRDLHDGQLLFDEDTRRVAVLDLDTAALAEPELDLANLLAHLDFAVLTESITRSMHDEVTAMVERLLAASGADPARFACYRTAAEQRIACVWAFRPRARDIAIAWLRGER